MATQIPSVTGARPTKLRDPLFEAWLAEQIRPWGPTANVCWANVCNVVTDWFEQGHLVKAHMPKPKNMPECLHGLKFEPVTLDTGQMDWSGAPFVLDTKGFPVFVDLGVRLKSLEHSCGASSRRTLNRQFEKIDSGPVTV